jgi:hypothetical protein
MRTRRAIVGKVAVDYGSETSEYVRAALLPTGPDAKRGSIQGDAPDEVRAGPVDRLQCERAPVGLGAAAEVGEAAAPGGVPHAGTVVADLEGDPVGRGGEIDVGVGRSGVAGDVGQRFAQKREQVVGDGVGEGVEQSREPDGGFEPEGGGDVGDDVE